MLAVEKGGQDALIAGSNGGCLSVGIPAVLAGIIPIHSAARRRLYPVVEMDSAAVHFEADAAEIVRAPILPERCERIAADLVSIGSEHTDVSRASVIMADRAGSRTTFAFARLASAVDLKVCTGAEYIGDSTLKVASEAGNERLITRRVLIDVAKDAHAAIPPLPL